MMDPKQKDLLTKTEIQIRPGVDAEARLCSNISILEGGCCVTTFMYC
jgi:hypothetical protein